MIPHYLQSRGTPAIQSEGPGVFACACGESPLIAGYAPENFLAIAIQCGACGDISETPGLPAGIAPPRAVLPLERGADSPPAKIAVGTVLIGKDELDRLAALYLPRRTEDSTYLIGDTFLDELEALQSRLTGAPLDPVPGFKDGPLSWAFAHFRQRLRDPAWAEFNGDEDAVAATVLGAFRDLVGSWGHHPLFPAMIGTVAARGYSFHAMAIFGTAKALALTGNRIGFVATEGVAPKIAAVRLVLDGRNDLSVNVARFDRFEWPDAPVATPQTMRAAVLEAMAAAQGHMNRLRPGMLFLSAGAADASLDHLMFEALTGAIASHGKRYRGLNAIGAILPKVQTTPVPREARFGYAFYPVANVSPAPPKPPRA